MAEPKEDMSYLDHDPEVLRELIQRGIDSGPGRPIDFAEIRRVAREKLADELKRQ